MAIKILESHIINQIRAGEVIERPVSAIKELIDNSLDANAEHIRITYSHGGKDFTIEDDGDGISEDDLPLALEKHATSKLFDINDIKTHGFRGEALASISHVANISITSRQEHRDAYKVTSSDCEIIPASGKKGTFIVCSDLFRDFPARREFLKSDSYEGSLIKKEVIEFALCNHTVSFELKNGKKDIFHYPVVNTVEDRISQIYGKDFLDNSLKVSGSVNSLISYTIFIPKPTWDKNGSIGQHIFVNKRHVSYPLISNAIKSTYNGISKNKNTDFICFISLPYEDVNCNIHPNKREVRIKDDIYLSKTINDSIKSSLSASKISAESLSRNLVDLLKKEPIHIQSTKSLPLGEPIGILKKNFVLSENMNGLIMIDLHAAHERIVLQKLLDNITNIPSVFINPVIVELNVEYRDLMQCNEDFFRSFGFDISESDNGFFINKIPEYIDKNKVSECIFDILNLMKNSNFSDIQKEIVFDVCSLIACHNAFRTGDDISLEEINSLLRQMEQTQFSAQCNHGRPTTIELSIHDIKGLFGR